MLSPVRPRINLRRQKHLQHTACYTCNIGNSFSDGSRKTRKQRQDRELQRAKPWGTSRQDGTQSPRGGRDTEAETEMKVRVRPARVGRGQRTEERADVTVRRRARGWRDLQKSPRGESRLNHGRPGPQEGACTGLQRGGPGVLSGVGLRVWLGACNVTAAVRRTHGAARTGTCGLGRESSDSAVLRVCSACHRPKDSAEKGQPERPGKAGPPGLWHGGWRLGRKRSRSQKWADAMPQSQRTGPERSLEGGCWDSTAAPPSPPNAAAQKQRFAGSRAQEGLCGWFRLRVPRWRQPDAGCWVGLCQHVVLGFPTWSLSHGRSGCPRSMLASGQSGHPHEGCGPSTRIPAQQAEPLCSATSFHDSCVTAPPTAQGKERSPVSHRLSTKAQEEHVEPEMPPQPALENATCPIMPAAVAPLGRSKRACRGEMEKNTRWLEVSSGKSKSLRIGSKNLFCIILETKVVSASVIKCRHAHVCARACTHTPAALGTL